MPPEDGGGLVSTSVPRKRGDDRRPLDRLVGGEVAGPEGAAVGDDEVADRRRDLAAVERLRPLGAEAFERLGELREGEALALAQARAARRVELARPRQSLVDRRRGSPAGRPAGG